MAVQVDRKTASKKQLADKLQQLAARRGQARSKVAAKKHRSPKRVLKAARVAVDTSPVPPVLALQLRTRIQLSQPLFSRLLAVSVRSVASPHRCGETPLERTLATDERSGRGHQERIAGGLAANTE
jgi:DNA-binding transcriptional regulator YiaG